MRQPSSLGVQIEDAFSRCADYVIHPIGHTKKVLRYLTVNKTPFAIRRDVVGKGRFWFGADDRLKLAIEAEGFSCGSSEANRRGDAATGRTSNLDQIPEFKGNLIYWTTVTTPDEALVVAAKMR